MKPIVFVVLLTGTVAVVTALPPLSNVIALVGFGDSEGKALDADYYEDDYDVTGGNTTGTTDETDDTDYTDETDTDDTDDTSDATDTTTPSTTSTTTEKPDDSLSGGAIAGIVIGSLAGVALIAGGIYYMKVKEIGCFKG